MTSSYNPTPNLRTADETNAARDEHRIREAAPELLAALERICTGWNNWEAHEMGLAAIALARGEPS